MLLRKSVYTNFICLKVYTLDRSLVYKHIAIRTMRLAPVALILMYITEIGSVVTGKNYILFFNY